MLEFGPEIGRVIQGASLGSLFRAPRKFIYHAGPPLLNFAVLLNSVVQFNGLEERKW